MQRSRRGLFLAVRGRCPITIIAAGVARGAWRGFCFDRQRGIVTTQRDASEGPSGTQGVDGRGRAVGASWGGAARVLCCVVAVVLADWLFYREPIGWTVGLYGALLAAAIVARGGRTPRSRPSRILMVLIVGLVIALVEYPGVLPIMLLAVALVSLSLARRWTELKPVPQWAGRVVAFAVTGWLRVFADARLVHKWLCRGGGRATERSRHLAQWLLAAALGLVFVLLFAVANPIIVRWGRQLGDNLVDLVAPGRILLWLLVGLWSWALLRGRVRIFRRPTAARLDVESTAAPVGTGPWLTASLVVRCLIVFNAVFLVQNGLDGLYLFGGAELPEGMGYAQYAHRGAYPLIAAALLAGLFVLITFRPGSSVQGHAACRRLVYAWLGQTVFLTFSSVWRLSLYVEAYSLTRWRLAAGIWMILVAVGLVSIVWRIVAGKSNAWLWQVNALTLTLVLCVASFVNFDGTIAQYNVRHCERITGHGPELDLAYLEHLGPESLPALQWYVQKTEGGDTFVGDPTGNVTGRVVELRAVPERPPTESINAEAKAVRARLRAELEQDLAHWRSWCWRRHRLAAGLLK